MPPDPEEVRAALEGRDAPLARSPFLQALVRAAYGDPEWKQAAVGSRGVGILPIVGGARTGVKYPSFVAYRFRNAPSTPPFRGQIEGWMTPKGEYMVTGGALKRGQAPVDFSTMFNAINMPKPPGFGPAPETTMRAAAALGDELQRAGVRRILASPTSPSRSRLFRGLLKGTGLEFAE